MARYKDRGRTKQRYCREKKLSRYNVERLGDLPTEREDGTVRVLVSQMGGCASRETREIKIAATQKLIRTYDINLCTFMELNFNWSKVNSSANFASWLQDEEENCARKQPTTHWNRTRRLASISQGAPV